MAERPTLRQSLSSAGSQLREQWRALLGAPKELLLTYVMKWFTSCARTQRPSPRPSQPARPLAGGDRAA